jgi:hypothetical protein
VNDDYSHRFILGQGRPLQKSAKWHMIVAE